MRLSLRGQYALRALLVLGLNQGNGVVRSETIAVQQQIPRRFLEQILNELKAAGMVESRRGAAGGYRLALAPEGISLATVIRVLEGPLAPVSCASDGFYQPCSCPSESKCALRSVMREVRDALVRVLEQMTLATLCERARQLAQPPTAPIEYQI